MNTCYQSCYGSEAWALKKAHMELLHSAKWSTSYSTLPYVATNVIPGVVSAYESTIFKGRTFHVTPACMA